MKYLVLLISLLSGFSVNAGMLVMGATVESMGSTDGNVNTFVVYFSGGSGVCASSGWVKFPVTATNGEVIHTRAYSTLLTALVSGKVVDIFNYTDDNCSGASYIRLYK